MKDIKEKAEKRLTDLPLIQEIVKKVENTFTSKRFKSGIKKSLVDFQNFVESSHELIFVLNMEGGFSYVSPNSEELLGFRQEELNNCHYTVVAHPEDIEYLKKSIAEIRNSGVWLKDMEYRILHKDRSVRWHLTTCSPIFNEEGAIKYFIGVARDITEQKMFDFNIREYVCGLEEQVLQAKKMKTIEEISEGILHGIKNNLGPVINGLEVIARTVTDEVTKRDLEILAATASESYNVIMDLLAYTRPEATATNIININDLIRSILSLCRNAYSDIEFHSNLSPHLYPVQGEKFALHQVFMDICLNAKDSIKKKGVISIASENIIPENEFFKKHLSHNQKFVLVKITDNGIGMDEHICAQVFNPFFTTKKNREGSGLGLAISNSTIRRHGGIIEVESIPGKGSTFYVYLPAYQEN